MQVRQDQIFEQALYMLAKGESLDAVQTAFPDYPTLKEELELVIQLQGIPKATPPAPTMRYKYTEKQSFWQQVFSAVRPYKLATIPLVIALVFGSGYSILQASENSLPGEKLYGVKVAAEQAKLQLTFDETKQAAMHVELAKKRLDEAKLAITLNNHDKEVAALDALAKQTQKTFQVTSQLAANKAVSEKDSSLLDHLVAINKEKKTVLQNAAQSSEAKEAAETALNNTKETEKDLARIIAAVNEQTLLDLPNKISVTGIISSHVKNTLTVEKNQFNVNSDTIILSQDGEPITDTTILSGQIAVIGTRNNNSLIAKKIVVIDPEAVITPEPTPTVAATKNPTTTPKPTETTEPTATEPTTKPEEVPVQQPSQASAGFIVEPSDQQYVP